MLDLKKILQDIEDLHNVTNEMAETIYAIRTKMEGRGVNPADAPMVTFELKAVEDKLRMLGANKNNIIPWITH